MRDPRLVCECGEIGQVLPDSFDDAVGFRVFCRRHGAPCCMTQHGATEEEAIAHFVALNKRDKEDAAEQRSRAIEMLKKEKEEKAKS